MTEISSRVAVRASFERAKENGDVLGRFYALFLASDPGVEQLFANTDFEQQKKALETSLETAIFTAVGDRYGQAELDRVRRSHGPGELDIPSRLYAIWRDCLIRAISEMDPSFDPALERRWQRILQPVIDYLTLPRDPD